MEKSMLVFDFDKTLIDCDSDNWVVEKLGLIDIFTQLLPTTPWNSLMDRMMMELHSRNYTIQDIADCLKQIPFNPTIISAIKAAHASGCDLRIVSDANVFFIKTILEHYGLMDCFSEIKTNPSYVDDQGRLRILPYHDFNISSHGCTICPPNMCKGAMIEKMRGGSKMKIVYVGDGSPDYCATLKLQKGDIVMPRINFPLWDSIQTNKHLVMANIEEWEEQEDLAAKLLNFIQDKPHPWIPIHCKL
ncbi:inorganic pyrophosphatase 2-like [Euphorbia lathyris]|uniref:inorganic pyrophosphatase 2-like n=1 Tax=Euphorbia lathyris TaxID=212925 RepID=UPI003313DD94